MHNELMKLIDDYAAWSAQSYWQDDQGYVWEAGTARANKEAARKAVVDAVAAMQAENERLKRELEINKLDAKMWWTQADDLRKDNDQLNYELQVIEENHFRLNKDCEKLRKENEKLVEVLEGIEHFSDAVDFHNDPLSRAMSQWIKEGRAILAKRKENNNEDAMSVEPHPDDIAVDQFAAAMKAKMAKQRAKGYGGWNDKDDCSTERLQKMLSDHIAKGDPVDVGNFAMMLWNRGERTAAPKQAEPSECYCCCGTGRVIRDPDIGTDQECFCCNGEGVVNEHTN